MLGYDIFTPYDKFKDPGVITAFSLRDFLKVGVQTESLDRRDQIRAEVDREASVMKSMVRPDEQLDMPLYRDLHNNIHRFDHLIESGSTYVRHSFFFIQIGRRRLQVELPFSFNH